MDKLDKLIDVLGSQRFADFYENNGAFGLWISGDYTDSIEAEDKMRLELEALFGHLLKG